jgi:Cu(I)/Ag(I) efflux system periplasmic protein CusF
LSHCLSRATVLALALAVAPLAGVLAQGAAQAENMPGVKVVPAKHVADGTVRKVSLETGRLTIQHGAIRHLGMPAMTTVFPIKDPSVLDKIQIGDKVKFVAERESGRVLVTDIKLAR